MLHFAYAASRDFRHYADTRYAADAIAARDATAIRHDAMLMMMLMFVKMNIALTAINK